MENFSQSLQQITQVIKKGFEKLGSFSFTSFTAPPPPPPITSAAAQSQPPSAMASSPGQFSTAPALTASATAPPPPATPAPPAQVTLTAPAPTSPPLAISTPTPGFAADLDDEDTSALLESLCSLPSSPRESVFSYDNHPPRNNLWPQHHPPTCTSPLQHMPAIAPSHPPQGGYFQTNFSSSQTVLPPQPQDSGAVYPPMLAQGSLVPRLSPASVQRTTFEPVVK